MQSHLAARFGIYRGRTPCANSRPVAAAIANAIFDATGVRPRRVPFTPERVGALFA